MYEEISNLCLSSYAATFTIGGQTVKIETQIALSMSNIGLIIEERAANIGNFMAGHQQATPWHADMGSLAPGAGGDGALLHSHPYGGDAHLGEGGDSDEAVDCAEQSPLHV